MKVSRGLLVIALLVVPAVGCGKKVEPPPPQPIPNGSARDEDGERARREAAERARIAEEERARAEAEERARREAARATLVEMVFFDYDDASIRSDAEAVLNAKIRVLRDYPQVRIRIAGHCDERGSNEYNLALGSRRASSVLAYLSSAGIGEGRIEIISYGEERPLAPGHDETSWSRNRRGEFQVLSGL